MSPLVAANRRGGCDVMHEHGQLHSIHVVSVDAIHLPGIGPGCSASILCYVLNTGGLELAAVICWSLALGAACVRFCVVCVFGA